MRTVPELSNSEGDIIIPRSELPHVENLGTGKIIGPTLSVYAGSYYADMMRKDAYERLAIAEHIDQLLNEQAKEKLLKEAVAICNKSIGLPFESQSPAMNVDHWVKVARAAREVYGIK